MDEDAPEELTSCRESLSSSVSFFALLFRLFKSKSELLSYLILCLVKMPFIPPVSIARSMSGLTGKEKTINSSPSFTSTASFSKIKREEKGSSVKDRLTSNLKQLGKKSQSQTHLQTPKGALGTELQQNRRGRVVPSSQTDSVPASSSGESLSKTPQQLRHASQGSVRSEPEVKTRVRHTEETRFTLTLTPEAVLLLQRRNSERRQHSAPRNAGSVTASASESRRRRETATKRHQPAAQRHSTPNSRAVTKSNRDGELADISTFVKISLLNDKHKYDDVEYEDEADYGVDERVVRKCTEWLRGLENSPVTVGNSLSRSTSGVKSF